MKLKELLKKAFEAGETYSGNIEFGEYAETFNDWYENNVVKNNVALAIVSKSVCPVCEIEHNGDNRFCNDCINRYYESFGK